MKKQLLLAFALVLTAATAVAQTLNIGGHRATLTVMDTVNNVWLCSVPQAYFGSDYVAAVSYGEEMSDVMIDGMAVISGDDVVFDVLEGGKLYALTAHLGDSVISGAITFTWLPIVELFGDFKSTYSEPTTVIVSEPDSVYSEPMLAKVKTRGGATNVAGKNKRNYHIKFLDEDSVTKINRRFFGLRNDNSWLLDAGQMDFLRVRNRVSTDLWLDMARRPWYTDTLPNARNGSRGQMVEVLLNGEYRGIYNMCEPIDRKQLKLKRYDEENKIFHGQLWTAYRWTRTVTMSDPAKRTNVYNWDGFELKYPEYSDVHRADWTTLENAVWFANRADKNSKLRTDSMGYYFDLPVMQDYFIFIVTLQALDNESKNIYYGCYDKQTHPRLTMVPWDLDICLGQNYAPNINRPDDVKPDRGLDWVSHLPMMDMWNMMDYHNEVVDRYFELRETVLDADSLVNRYRAAIDELENCGAAAREESRWSGDTDLARKDLDLSAEMDNVEAWIRARLEYADQHIFVKMTQPIYIPGDVNGDGEVNIADINALIDIILGGSADENTLERADVNKDGEINIADVNAVIDIILSGGTN